MFKNKRIAILTPTFMQFSGIDRVAELQAKELAKQNQVEVFTFKADIKLKSIKIHTLGIPASATKERLYRLLFLYQKNKAKAVAKRLKDFDIMIAHFYPMTVIASYAKKMFPEIKYIYYNHGIAYPELFAKTAERTYLRLFKQFTKQSIKNADSAISISNFLKKELKKETGLDSKVIYNKIDTKRFNKNVKSSKIIKSKYHLKGSKVILYIGRISPHKGIHLLIKAFNKVLEKQPNTKLLIVGKPTFDAYSKKCKAIIKKNVVFTGFVKDKDLPSYYDTADLYATGSLWEGFNLTIAEANACGKPVVAFNIGPHAEVIKKGKLVEKENINAFADAMLSYLK